MGLFDFLRRKQRYPNETGGWTENVNVGGIPTNVVNVGLPRGIRELVARNPNVGTDDEDTFKRISNFTPQDQSTIAQQPEPVRAPDEQTPISPRTSTFTPVDASEALTRPRRVEAANAPPPTDDFQRNPDYAGEGVSSQGESTIRPRWTSPMNQEMEHNAATREAYAHPDKAHGLRRFAPVLEGFARGVAGTGSLAGGLGGAATGLGVSILDPRAGNKLKYGRELAQSDATLAGMHKSRQAQLDEQGKIATIENTRANTFKTLHPQPANKQHVTVNDTPYVFDPESGLYTESNLPRGTKAKALKSGSDELGPYLYDPTDPKAEVIRPKGAELKQFIDVEGYGRMTPAQKYAADQTREGANVGIANTFSDKQTQELNEQSEREFQDKVAAWKDADTEARDFNKLHDELDDALADYQKTAETVNALANQSELSDKDAARLQEARVHYKEAENKIARLKKQATERAGFINSNYGDYVTYGTDERFVTRSRPTRPSVVRRPAPQTRSAPSAGGQSASPSGPPWTEEQVRARAKARGKNEDAAVEAARKHGQLK